MTLKLKRRALSPCITLTHRSSTPAAFNQNLNSNSPLNNNCNNQ